MWRILMRGGSNPTWSSMKMAQSGKYEKIVQTLLHAYRTALDPMSSFSKR
jgi:hypothetical protein